MRIQKLLPLILIVVATMIPLMGLWPQGLPLTHDGQDHVARIANFYLDLKEGIIVPRWAGNLNWGYGHPILMFLYPLPSYFASIFHFLGFSFVDSVKIVFGFSFILSAAAMYLWISSAYSKSAGFVAALLYAFAPYRFVDLYVRGALGEHIAFIFPPLVMYFIYIVTRPQLRLGRYFFSLGLSLSICGLILSHNAIALMYMPIFILYGIYLFIYEAKRDWKFVLQVSLYVALGFGLASFFWFPAFFEGKYTLRDIVTGSETLKRFAPWSWIFYSPWNYGGGDDFTKTLGITQWVGVILSFAVLFLAKVKKLRIFIVGSLAVLFATLFIMTVWSKPVWLIITILQKFQFPWRFLTVAIFASSVLGGIAVSEWSKQMKHALVLKVGISLIIIMSTWFMWHPKDYVQKSESFYTGTYFGTTDTGESSPIWSVRFMEHVPVSPIQIIDGDAQIDTLFRSSIRHEYMITSTESARILENTLYFPGWNIYVDNKPVDVQFQDPEYRGLMTFVISKGQHKVRVVFEDTKLRKIANIISIVTVIALGCIGIAVSRKRKKS